MDGMPEEQRTVIAVQRRQEAFENGEYELSDDEGLFCWDCDWRGLSAPMNVDNDGNISDDEEICMCPECGSNVYMKGSVDEYLEPFKPTAR